MKLYAPKYYKNFKCIADKCEHSCCVGWEIDIDQDSYEKYKAMDGGYAESIKNSISAEETPHFKLCAHDRCPHLDERGLCKIILNMGEDCLCDICREHPRFYNYTDVAEVGLGMSCREAARLILSSPDYAILEEVGEVDAEEDTVDFNCRAERQRIYGLLQDESIGYEEKLAKLQRFYGIDVGEDAWWKEKLDRLEYLDNAHKELFLNYSHKNRPVGKKEYLERALAYFLYRHLTEAADEEDLYCRLAFCLFLEMLLASLIVSCGAQSLQEIAALASVISEEIEYSEQNTEALTYC